MRERRSARARERVRENMKTLYVLLGRERNVCQSDGFQLASPTSFGAGLEHCSARLDIRFVVDEDVSVMQKDIAGI